MLAPRFAAGFAGGIPAFGRRRCKRQRQSALDHRGRRHRSRPIDLDRARIQYTRWLAYLLAQSRGLGPGHDAALDAARRGDRRGHSLARAASLRASAAGQLRLCQARDAPGADHGGPRPQGRGAARTCRPGELAGVCRRVHSRECAIALAAAGQCRRRRHRSRCRSLVRGRPRRAAEQAAGGDRREDRGRSFGAHARQGMGRHAAANQHIGVLPL